MELVSAGTGIPTTAHMWSARLPAGGDEDATLLAKTPNDIVSMAS